MLKSATRNSARHHGKENTNAPNTPALGRIEEDMDMTNVPVESSLYGPSRNTSIQATPLPVVDDSSDASTPIVLLPRRSNDKGPLQDGNQLSLREQEKVIDRIEKENFGLKLKIHFLEEALRKSGPDFSEAAVRENTELKVDKVTMQRELHKYKKHLASAEKDLETYEQQMLDIQEKAKKKYADESQKIEVENLRSQLEEKDSEIRNLREQLQQNDGADDKVNQLQDEIGDLEADLRAKDRELNEREDELDEVKTKMEEAEKELRSTHDKIAELEKAQPSEDTGKLDELRDKIADLEADLREKDLDLNERDEELNELETKLSEAEQKWKSAQQKIEELNENPKSSEELAEAKGSIGDLEATVRRLEQQLEDMKDQLQQALSDKERAEDDLEELQEEMSNKSMVTKGFSRQLEEKSTRLQTELSVFQAKYTSLEQEVAKKDRFTDELKKKAEQLLQQRESWDTERHSLMSKLELAQKDLRTRTDEKDLLQTRNDALGAESTSLQRDITRLQKEIADLEDSLEQEKTHALQMEHELQDKHQSEIDRLHDDILDLQDEVKHLRQDGDQSASLEREVTRLRGRINELEEMLEKERTTARNRQNASTDEATALQREITRLKNQISELEDDLRREKTNTRDRNNASGEELTASQREIARLQKQVSDLESSLEREKSSIRNRQNSAIEESTTAQREVARLQRRINDLEADLGHEKSNAGHLEQDIRSQLRAEIDRLNDEISDLQTSLRDKDNTYHNDSERWESEKRDLKAQRERVEERARGLQQTIDRLRAAEGTLSNKETQLQEALDSETQRHQREESALSRQIDGLRQDLEARQAALTALRDEVSAVRDELRQSQLECQTQRDKVEALEDEVEVLQATLDEESEEANQRLREADQAFEDLKRHQLAQERARRDRSPQHHQQQQTSHLERQQHQQQLEEAHRAADDLRRQLADANQQLKEARRQADRAARKDARHAEQRLADAERRCEDLRAQLEQANKAAEAANRVCDGLRRELDHHQQQAAAAPGPSPALLCEELRARLDRARGERAAYKAAAQKLQDDCERLKEGAREALAWIEARNAEQQRQQNQPSPSPSSSAAAAVARRRGTTGAGAAKASIRYGDLVMDVVDQRDHEAVIRAADAAERRHAKEIRGMALQAEWMQARWEREARLRHDAAFAKKFLALRLDIAEAWLVPPPVSSCPFFFFSLPFFSLRPLLFFFPFPRFFFWGGEGIRSKEEGKVSKGEQLSLTAHAHNSNKADLRILRSIHKQLGIKSPDALLSSSRRKQEQERSAVLYSHGHGHGRGRGHGGDNDDDYDDDHDEDGNEKKKKKKNSNNNNNNNSSSDKNGSSGNNKGRRKPGYHEVRARAQRNLRVFAAALRAVGRMRVDARSWAGHEKTRLRLVRALEEGRRAEAEAEIAGAYVA